MHACSEQMSSLDQLLLTMQEMLHRASHDDWREVEKLDLRRKSLIEQLPAFPDPLPAQAREKIERIIDLDKTIIELALSTRQSAVKAIQALSAQQTACAQYRQNQKYA